MKRLKLLTALGMGIMASTSGVLQVEAANIVFLTDFSTKEVANYDNFVQTFSVDTYNLDARITFNWQGTYFFDSCPTAFTLNVNYLVGYRLNNVAPTFFFPAVSIPDFVCTTTQTPFVASGTNVLPESIVLRLMNDDTNFIRFFVFLQFFNIQSTPSGVANGRTLTIRNYTNFFDVSYDFNTTYLFNYFLSDQQFISKSPAATSGSWVVGSTQSVYLSYVYTTAGNDTYYIANSTLATIGTTRKRYAIDYEDQFFRGQSVGASFRADYVGNDSFTFPVGANGDIVWQYDYHYLNTANNAQAIVDAPVFDFEYDDCGNFLALNVGCFINNAFAYITNDAPIVSDAFTLLNAGIEMAAQTFGIIGEFADDNVFGVLILAGFGFIAVKWFLKND
jgi:hypothetical protein